MQHTHTSRREQLLDLCRRDPETVVDMVLDLLQTVEELRQEIADLKRELADLKAQQHQDSHNSHKPPSTDFGRPAIKSLRTKSNRSSGGQTGHSGTTLKMAATPDTVIPHRVIECLECGTRLASVKPERMERRQVHDIPQPRLVVTEHQAEVKTCPDCGRINRGTFPAAVAKAVQYGPMMKSTAGYLMFQQLLPAHRTCQTLEDLTGAKVSEGSLFNWGEELSGHLAEAEEAVKDHLRTSEVIHNDETGCASPGHRDWLHVVSTEKATFYQVHPKRGRGALDAIGILPTFTGTVVHDMYASYFSYTRCRHSVCNAHIVRELIFAHEEDHQRWAEKLKKLLLRGHALVERAKDQGRLALARSTLVNYAKRYDQYLANALRCNPRQKGIAHRRGRTKQTKTRNLIDRLIAHKQSALLFMYDFRVPFTNNLAERDLRMPKVKQKISGTFRSTWGAPLFCRIRGYLSTVRKNGVPAFGALLRAFSGAPFILSTNYAE